MRGALLEVVSIEEHSLSISTEISAQSFSFYSNKHFVIHIMIFKAGLGMGRREGRHLIGVTENRSGKGNIK